MAIIYTHNDSPNSPHVFSVDVETGVTVGTFDVTDSVNIVNPQAIRLDWTNGKLYLADIGDRQNSRHDIALWMVQEPGPGNHGTLDGVRYLLSYPFGPRDAEALAIHPITGAKYIITKEAVGKLVRLPTTLGGNNACTDMSKPMPANVTDACFTMDGKWLLIRAENVKDTIVYSGSSFTFSGYITTPQVAEGRSITMEPHGKCFLVGSEGQFSPIFRVCLPAQYQADPPRVVLGTAVRKVGVPQPISLFGFIPNNPDITLRFKSPSGAITTATVSPNSSGAYTNNGATFTPDAAGVWVITATQTPTGATLQAGTSVTISTTGGSPTPELPTGLVTNIHDNALCESSGLAYSKAHSNVVWTHNDEGGSPQVYGISLTTGNTVATYGVSGTSLQDPESIRVHPVTGAVWLADIGDNDNNRSNCRIVVTQPEPDLGSSGTISSTRYPISYPEGPQNAEALLIHPVTGIPYIITKSTSARLYRVSMPMNTSNNVLINMNKSMPDDVTDATFTTDGRFVLIRSKIFQSTLVYNSTDWTQEGTIATPAVNKGESITVEPGGKTFLIGSEGCESPIYRVAIPAQWQPDSGGGGGTCDATDKPADWINLTNWKLTLPIPLGNGNDPTEITQNGSPDLGTYEHSTYFFTLCPDKAVVFRAPVNGATTSNSGNPRCELREMKANGTQNASWNMASGTHTLEVNFAFTRRPNKENGTDPVVCGQIHGTGDGSDDVTVCRLEGANVVATAGDNETVAKGARVLIPNYKLGTYFTLKMVAGPWGVRYYINNVLKTTLSMDYLESKGAFPTGKSGMYFKAGCYTQCNSSNYAGSGDTYGEVRIKTLKVTHT